MKPPSLVFTSNNQIAKACGVDGATVKGWLAVDGFPVKGKNGYPRAEVMEFAARKMADHAKQITGENRDLKRERLSRQIAKLNEDIRRARADATVAEIEARERRNELIPLADHAADIRTLAAEVKAGLEQWVQFVAAEIKDPSVYMKAIETRDRLLLMLAEKEDDSQPIAQVLATSDTTSGTT